MGAKLGGKVQAGHHREFGRAFVDVVDDCALFEGVWPKGAREQVWMSHGDRVISLPEGFRVVGTSDGAPFAAIADRSEEHTSELQSLMRISYADFCLKKNNIRQTNNTK